tara:strand:+ start:1034 stop:1222 length:189 start_codon:yes stop_codon:yes gene_type:complete
MATRYQNYATYVDVDGNTQSHKAIKRILDDGTITSIPTNEGNTDYQKYLAWVAEGNTAEEAD